MISEIAGQSVELAILDDVAQGAYALAPFGAADVAAASSVIQHYTDLRLGLADASIAALADRYACDEVLTLDQRHCRAITSPTGAPYRLLPADSA